jgi:hypothetical protein
MTMVNKVCALVSLDDDVAAMMNADNGTASCLCTQLFHELPAFVHIVTCMCPVHFCSEKVQDHLIPQF